MVSMLFAALFASGTIAADITTSVWLPGAANANQTLIGSVIEKNGDQTILSLSFASTPSTPDYYSRAPSTVTMGGTTYIAYNVSASDSGIANAATVTIELECKRQSGASAIPTCTLSTLGANRIVSEVCGGLLSQYYINNFPLIITAGTEKLGVSAGATPKASSATVTQSGAGFGVARIAGPSQTNSGSGSAQQATGAATPMKTAAPALVGLGAAAAAFFL
ncbi:hypothetical protein GQ44DRAFT_609747 [Phaeosphaeriaceae sp. PMI808]|nr:hypothetical protein GQ44DRAFT_609747 [Phaeosphaeriaceae sp. PMI808]